MMHVGHGQLLLCCVISYLFLFVFNWLLTQQSAMQRISSGLSLGDQHRLTAFAFFLSLAFCLFTLPTNTKT